MLRIGIIGFGFMGRAHFEAYQKIAVARVVAISTRHLKSVTESGGYSNIKGVGQSHLNLDGVQLVKGCHQLFAANDVDVVDVCTPTPTHLAIVTAALKAGKHVVCEKPVGRTFKETQQISAAAAKAKTFFMPAMVMRFWPEWVWLKNAVEQKRYGKVLSATFQRLSPLPPKTRWTRDGKASGGALLDLHVHDTDFVYWLFGMPRAVFSRGYPFVSGEPDHIHTHYLYDRVPLVTAEGGWHLDEGMPFTMRYTVKFQHATADFDLGRKPTLLLAKNGKVEAVKCATANAYQAELSYFLECVRRDEKPKTVTAQDATAGMKIIEAEAESCCRGETVACR